ncbi:MAG: dihydropteroate synthase [Muribaculaceae bacterium]|nr:dihydropteroate synthase [Muribaculaceae bacterium]MDE5924210.1 dihydropteroate synthase [Muribaculaceae bacterium]
MDYTIRMRNGSLTDLKEPMVMGIINATPDSFYSGSRTPGREGVRARASRLLAEGAACLDVGGYSSRPGCDDIPASEEWRRLDMALSEIRDVAGNDVVISVDTFRADVALKCVERWGVDIINDISGGMADPEMTRAVAESGAAYVLMHMRGTPQTMTSLTDYDDVTSEVVGALAFRLAELRAAGVADVIVDPGFGFAKTTEQNYQLLDRLEEFRRLECPILAGLSRKSMIWRPLGITPDESLAGTTALNMAALMKGASILRVHDVKEAVQTVELYKLMCGAGV